MLVPLLISTLVLFSLIVVAVAFPDFTENLVVPAGKVTVWLAPAVKVPCQVVVLLMITLTQAVEVVAARVTVLSVVGQFLTVTACIELLSAATLTLNFLEDFLVVFLELDEALLEEELFSLEDDFFTLEDVALLEDSDFLLEVLDDDFLLEDFLAFDSLDTVTELESLGIAGLEF